ncbi:hypothetical protein CTEN210_18677 [Chaetoceros tenuissimus]|uniref:N-acetylgalactosaminide beta-1,3-galactosyltransferase n=1 Tax=Chaetoceros tenuissimus TaxID=426638 RepID=A0AAD3DDA1_9STRA|nr:hypothetical protein CTEN210_18677 [Chaetoceros tenuissimus]
MQNRTVKKQSHKNIPSAEKRIGPNGEKGYVHNPKFSFQDLDLNSTNINHNVLCKDLNEFEEIASYRIKKQIQSDYDVSRKKISIFCAVYTYSKHKDFTKAIQETWGKKCDGLLFASDISDFESGHVHLPSNSIYGFSYKGIIQKLRVMYSYVYDNFLNDYDYFHFVGDDAYLIMENLRYFLTSKKVQMWEDRKDRYLIAGFWMSFGKMKPKDFFLAGGSGYTLSRKALKEYVEGPLQNCSIEKEGSQEDVFFTNCVKEYMTKEFIFTGDEDGSQRYHQAPLYAPLRNSVVRKSIQNMQKLTNISLILSKNDVNVISNTTIAFHQHKHPDELRRLELIFYGNYRHVCDL